MSIFAKVMEEFKKVPLRPCDAIVLFTGEGEIKRILYAVCLFQKAYAKILFAVGGTLDPDFQKIIIEFLGSADSCVFSDSNFNNTHEQALWVVDNLKKNPRVRSAIVVSACYHLPRTFLTLLKVLDDNNHRIVLVPACPLEESFEQKLIPKEEKRIIAYQRKGHVATLEHLDDYLNWLKTSGA